MAIRDSVLVIDPQRLRADAVVAALTALRLPATTDASATSRADVAVVHATFTLPPEADRVLADDDCRVLLLVAAGAEPKQALTNRCFGVLERDLTVEALADVVRDARHGRPPRRWESGTALTEGQRSKAALVQRLSPRERSILALVATGGRNDEIGAQLGISANTVRTHVQNILGKLEVSSRVAAVAAARQGGLTLAGHSDGVER
jgi:DNA-binding NarL/FixJ family response regulator